MSAVSRVKKGFKKPCVPAGVDGGAGEEGLSGRARGYLEVVRDLNRAQVAGEGFDAAGRFGAAASRDPPGAIASVGPTQPQNFHSIVRS